MRSEVKRVEDLTPAETEAMLALLDAHFTSVTREGFAKDLAEKEWALLVRDKAGEIRGFSTACRLTVDGCGPDGESVDALFSGDTIVAAGARSRPDLALLFGELAFRIVPRRAGRPLHWFLICSGWRTYRFLPLLFRGYVPTRGGPGPLLPLRDPVSRARFGERFDAATGIVTLAAPAPLRDPEVGPRELADPDVAFFVAANPGHGRGDELACLTTLEPGNLTPAGRRLARLG